VSGLDLAAGWRATIADEGLRRAYPDEAFDDGDWPPIPVPGHWRSVPALASTDGPVLYRTRFATPPMQDANDLAPTAEDEGDGRRDWLSLEGVFYTSDVWLDGTYLGDTEGYFFPHAFEVTDALASRAEHVLAIEVACAPQDDRTRKRNLTGVFQHWDLLDQDWNPGGIWRPVRIEQSGPVRIRHSRVLCREATEDRATVFLRVVLDTLEHRTVEVRTIIAAPDGVEVLELQSERSLAAGENRLEWTVAVPEPRLWWPAALGDQPLYEVTVEVRTATGAVSDRRTRRLGLRRIELRDWVCSVNGERLFLKGANQGPSRMALAEATPDELARDVRLARDTGLDLLRVHGHISRPELYDAADETGLLIWQDLPLQWGYARGVRPQARRQAREAVDLLAHHASVAIWCGHNEPLALDIEPEAWADPHRSRRLAVKAMAAQMLPTWNKSVLDHSIASVLKKTDGSRPVVPHSGVLPHPPQLDGTDTHAYFGWYWGDERDFPRLLRWWPRVARFVTEFGAQAVPDEADFLDPDRWPDLDWNRAWRSHALQKTLFDRYVPPADYDTFEAWRDATQAYQAELIRRHVEELRRLKYRPTGGFAQFCFADGYPSVTWSVLDHERRPKAGYAALAEACRPVIVVADRPPAHVHPGDHLDLDVHVVSDLHAPLDGLVVHARLGLTPTHGGDAQRIWRRTWQGDVPTDACVRVGTVAIDIPEVEGTLTLDLELIGPGPGASAPGWASNRYATRIAVGAHDHHAPEPATGHRAPPVRL